MRFAYLFADTARRDEDEPLWYSGALLLLVVIAQLALYPYTAFLRSQLPRAQLGSRSIAGDALAILLDVGLTYVLIGMGIRAGRRVQLGWPPLDGWNTGADGATRRRDAVITAILLGAAVALLLPIALSLMGDPWPMPHMQLPPIWMAAIASAGAGIYEEIWFRLGALTLVASLLTRLTQGESSKRGIFWTANAVAALLFGSAHLPLANAMTPLTTSVVAFVILANGCVGLACGWLYWRRGLVAAMIAHTTVDLVLKVALPLIGTGM